MPTSRKKGPPTLNDTIVSLRKVVLAAGTLAPGVVPVIILVAALVILVSLLSVKIMVGVTVLVVFFAAMFVYHKTNDYAQSAIALVLGLLTSFTVDWKVGRFL